MAKHAGASGVRVTVRGLPHLTFSVTDDGRGFDRSRVEPGGLLGMEARMAAAGGTLRLDVGAGPRHHAARRVPATGRRRLTIANLTGCPSQ